ncbi:MAG: lamin tail domain-containing protein [Myxococcales bacterium]|nr:lamin tail domain-containing protein [Myxococcales bacterium]
MRIRHLIAAGALATGALAGCAPEADDPTVALPFDDLLVEAGKADQVSNAHILDDIDLDSVIEGKFDPRVRVYGFTFEAKAGASIKVDLRTRAGHDSFDAQPDKPLDTVAAIYGPMRGADKGRRVASSDDTDHGVEADLPEVEIAEDGRYLVIFSSWNDPGAGSYDVGVKCSGTNFQCRRPVTQTACLPGTRYIQGQTVVGDETWSRCNVVLLETTVVEDGATLSIGPGVNVKGNYLGEGDFGEVTLQVDGRLQAVGTAREPVVFTALVEGWNGVQLNGDDNTLEHVFVEKAARGVDVRGSQNTLHHLTIDHGGLGLRFAADSVGNTLKHARLAALKDGIVQLEGSALDSDDVIVAGTGEGVGLHATRTAESTMRGAVVSGFATGLHFDDAAYFFYDTTVAQNTKGVEVTGPEGGVNPAFTCPAMPAATTPSRPRPAPPVSWPRDPAFVRCDIVDNAEQGVHVLAPQLVVIEGSNVRGNGAGVVIEADSLHADSRINASNVLDNGDTWQIDAWHQNGVLDISGNFWDRISDPELSSSWRVNHETTHACRATRTNMNGCTWRNPNYICGPYTCTRGGGNQWNCRATDARATWQGEVEFTGFSPVELEAGPDLTKLSGAVNGEREKLGYAAGEAPAPTPVLEGTLVINEIDYDQPGRDDAEFVELFNPGDTAIDLRKYVLELVNGSNGQPYARIPLAEAADDQTDATGTLPAGAFLVVGAEKVLDGLPAGVRRVALRTAIQNGSPDGLRVVNLDGDVVDGLAYEGWMAYVGEGDAPLDRESNSGLNESLGRCKDGADSDDNAKDFHAMVPTPGAANRCE